jgi:molybdopterin-containing oxidoreductase family membrane subunit
MFVIMSFAWGLAMFIIVQSVMFSWNGIQLDPAVLRRMKNLLATFVAAVLYFTVVYHLTNLYFSKQVAVERFFLIEGGVYTTLFWWGQIIVGGIIPLGILLSDLGKCSKMVMMAAIMVVLGAFAHLYVLIIGGQAFPLDLFPDMKESSKFFDGVVHSYAPSLPEVLLGMGGFGVAFLLVTVAVRALHFMPQDDFKAVAAETIAD